MPLTDDDSRNHDRLFGESVSTLGRTDPELVEYFDNFALGDVLAHGALDDRTRLLVVLAALVACQAHGEYRLMLRAALDNGISPTEAKEVLYQAVAYLGIGKVYDHPRDPLRAGLGGSVRHRRCRAAHGDARRRHRRPAAHPAMADGELLRRPLHARRDRPAYS